MRTILILWAVMLLSSCHYQPILERDYKHETALIPVKINWSRSGFDIDASGKSKQSNSSVHRATVRFFPKDGSESFERYLEGNVFEGEIEVPIGSYSIIIMNESHTDPYWNGSSSGGYESIVFENVDSYENFSASVKLHDNNPTGYFFEEYVASNYKFMFRPLQLASWNIDHFEVTEELVEYTRALQASKYGKGKSDSGEDIDEMPQFSRAFDEKMYYALTRDDENDTDGVDMRKLTRDVEITLRVKNLTSISKITGAIDGFVNKVSMRTGDGFKEPAGQNMLQYFTFNGRKNWYSPDNRPMGEDWRPNSSGDNIYEGYTGETSVSFLSFGRNIPFETKGGNTQGTYMLDLDFVYITGDLNNRDMLFQIDHDNDSTTPNIEAKIPFDITNQVIEGAGMDKYYLGIKVRISTLEVEHRDADIHVEEWGDEVVVPL